MEGPMAYTISYAMPTAGFSVTKQTAQEALEIAMEYIDQGYHNIRLEDSNAGVTYGEHQIRKAWESGKGLEQNAHRT
jgi:hypothetical protein